MNNNETTNPTNSIAGVIGPLTASHNKQLEPDVENTPGRITWLASRVRHLSNDLAATRAIWTAEINRLTSELNELTTTAESQINFLKDELIGYHRASLADGGPKTKKLPGGTLKAVKARAKLEITNDVDLIIHATEHGDDSLLTVKPALAGVKARFAQVLADADELADKLGFNRATATEPLVVTSEMLVQAGYACPSFLQVTVAADGVSFSPAK